jgi:hypothetical protein
MVSFRKPVCSFAIVMSAIPCLEIFAELLRDIIEVARIIIHFPFPLVRIHWRRNLRLGIVLIVVRECTSTLSKFLTVLSEFTWSFGTVVHRWHGLGGWESTCILVQKSALTFSKFITGIAEFAWSSSVTALHIY